MSLSDRILRNDAASHALVIPRKPSWIRAQMPSGDSYERLRLLVAEKGLHTICQEASCPNIGECWARGTATIMILGDICTRSCGFCNVRTGKPLPVDPSEARRVATAIAALDLRHIVVTCVDRDDLPDGGAAAWADTIRAIHRESPDTTVEALVGDLQGDTGDLDVLIAAAPEILAHNIETVQRMHPAVRPQARYERSLAVLRHIADAGCRCKTGIMVGIGETDEEVDQVLRDIREKGHASILTIGQYLQPTRNHLPVDRWVHPSQFDAWRDQALDIGFEVVESGPLVRSSYHAEEQACRPVQGTS